MLDDADSARLQALSVQSAAMNTPFIPTQDSSPTATQLAETDSELTVAKKTLGPNNPAFQELQAKRAALAEDHDNAPVFLARNKWELDTTTKEWPALAFKATREQA